MLAMPGQVSFAALLTMGLGGCGIIAGAGEFIDGEPTSSATGAGGASGSSAIGTGGAATATATSTGGNLSASSTVTGGTGMGGAAGSTSSTMTSSTTTGMGPCANLDPSDCGVPGECQYYVCVGTQCMLHNKAGGALCNGGLDQCNGNGSCVDCFD